MTRAWVVVDLAFGDSGKGTITDWLEEKKRRPREIIAMFCDAGKGLNAAHAAGKKFHHFVMTTSNHRPFTYPDRRIDIRSPGGREGAVKYTDWAIGDFVERLVPADRLEELVAEQSTRDAYRAELATLLQTYKNLR